VKLVQNRFIALLLFMFIGLTMLSSANAATPEENKKAGETFLAANAKKANIKTTASGLQYEVISAGKGGTAPKATDTVTVHYKGTTIDGKEFDSSYSRNEPTSFPLNGVIAGWTEGVQLMKTGDKYRFYIPANLAYGERGAGGVIPPNAALIFDIELLSIQ
jgi:FKBP-type peptidyl-prolyl cis-trans isomerase